MAIRKKLEEAIVSNSMAENFNDASKEWAITGCVLDRNGKSTCICGQHGLQYLYTIVNHFTGVVLSPIGSDCIKRFSNKAVYEEALLIGQLLDIAQTAVDYKKKTGRLAPEEVTFKMFSRKLLDYMYRQGAFPANKFNRWNGRNDYEFVLGSFNNRYRNEKQESKERVMLDNMLKWCIAYAVKMAK